MPDKTLTEIIQTCLKLEGRAIRVYRSFAERSEGDLKTFWTRMKNQEREHIRYWRTLLELAEADSIHNVFDDPEQVLNELRQTEEKGDERVEQALSAENTTQHFLIAYHLEFIMLHPAFEAMFLLMRNKTGDRSPSEDYLKHINQLIGKVHELGKDNAEIQLIADLTARIWMQNHMIAEQLADIREMRGLVPICMYCKNIRDDDGFWKKVENYVEARSHAEFSHGVCPDCLRKHYGDVLSEEDIKELEKDKGQSS